MLQATVDVIQFEARRTRTRGRILLWLGLALIPSLLLILMQSQARGEIPETALVVFGYYLVAQVSCMLGLLLWATPAIGSELEAQTWIFVALRQHGKVAVLIGKYLVAAAWTASACCLSAVGVAFASQHSEPLRLAACLVTLACLASLCYAALYILIGVAIHTRATVLAVVYTLLVEGLLSNVPATINKLTVSHRLQSILQDWMGTGPIGPDMIALFGYEPIWQHVAWLILYIGIVMTAALWLMFYKEFPVSSDG